MSVHVTRAYDDVTPSDGTRVLVDRLWPRGVSKERAQIDVWLKAIAPSTELRTSWHSTEGWHEGAGFDTFTAAYRDELTGPNASDETRQAITELRELVQETDTVTLVTASKDPQISHVAVLLDVLA